MRSRNKSSAMDLPDEDLESRTEALGRKRKHPNVLQADAYEFEPVEKRQRLDDLHNNDVSRRSSKESGEISTSLDSSRRVSYGSFNAGGVSDDGGVEISPHRRPSTLSLPPTNADLETNDDGGDVDEDDALEKPIFPTDAALYAKPEGVTDRAAKEYKKSKFGFSQAPDAGGPGIRSKVSPISDFGDAPITLQRSTKRKRGLENDDTQPDVDNSPFWLRNIEPDSLKFKVTDLAYRPPLRSVEEILRRMVVRGGELHARARRYLKSAYAQLNVPKQRTTILNKASLRTSMSLDNLRNMLSKPRGFFLRPMDLDDILAAGGHASLLGAAQILLQQSPTAACSQVLLQLAEDAAFSRHAMESLEAYFKINYVGEDSGDDWPSRRKRKHAMPQPDDRRGAHQDTSRSFDDLRNKVAGEGAAVLTLDTTSVLPDHARSNDLQATKWDVKTVTPATHQTELPRASKKSRFAYKYTEPEDWSERQRKLDRLSITEMEWMLLDPTKFIRPLHTSDVYDSNKLQVAVDDVCETRFWTLDKALIYLARGKLHQVAARITLEKYFNECYRGSFTSADEEERYGPELLRNVVDKEITGDNDDKESVDDYPHTNSANWADRGRTAATKARSEEGANNHGPLRLSQVSDLEQELQRRYFSITNPACLVRCLCCGAEGHMEGDCPLLTCVHCGALDQHFAGACPAYQKCGRCRQCGHEAVTCMYFSMSASALGDTCDVCGRSGHVEEECAELWRTFSTNEGSVKKIPKRAMRKGCYNCGSSAHWGDDCISLPLHVRRLTGLNQTWSAEHANIFIEDAEVRHSVAVEGNGGGRNYQLALLNDML